MKEHYYTVEGIAELLHMHPKTIQRYIREGKLRARKIGKSWRITGHDLSLFTEENPSEQTRERDLTLPVERVRITSVVDIRVRNKEDALRIITNFNAAMNEKPTEYGEASLATQYIGTEETVRLTLWGSIQFMQAIFSMIENVMEQTKE